MKEDGESVGFGVDGLEVRELGRDVDGHEPGAEGVVV